MTWLLAIPGLLRRLPWQVYLVLGLALALFLAWRWHSGEVRESYANGAKEGAERAYARVEAKAKALDAEAIASAAKIRSKFDEASRDVDVVTRTVLVRGPGAAACSVAPAARPGGPVAPGGTGDNPVGPMPSGEGQPLAGVLWPDLVEVARQCDLNRLEALAWREQRAEQVRAYERAK